MKVMLLHPAQGSNEASYPLWNKYNQSFIKVITYNDNNNKTSATQVKIYLAVHKLESQNSLKQERKGLSVIHWSLTQTKC